MSNDEVDVRRRTEDGSARNEPRPGGAVPMLIALAGPPVSSRFGGPVDPAQVIRSALRNVMLPRPGATVPTMIRQVVVHGCRVPIPHLVVAPSGVWIVASETPATVELQQAVPDSLAEPSLILDGRDRTEVIDRLTWQRSGLAQVLSGIIDQADVHAVMVCAADESAVAPISLEVHDVRIVSETPLRHLLTGPAALTDEQVASVLGSLEPDHDGPEVIDLRATLNGDSEESTLLGTA